jgi:hypothetical protein
VRHPLDSGAGEAPGVPAGCWRLGHATALDAGLLLLLPFKLHPPIHHTSSRHHYVVLLPISTAALFDQGSGWVRRRLRCDPANGENAARPAVPRSGMALRFAGAGSTTDAAGILGPFVLIGVRGDQQRSAWDLVQWRARWGQWRKCLTVVAILRSILLQWSAGLDPALAGIRRAISSSRSRRSRPVELRWIENASSGGHTTPGNVISMLHRPDLRLEPTYLPLSWKAHGLPAAKLPKYLTRLVMMRSVCRFQAQSLLQE